MTLRNQNLHLKRFVVGFLAAPLGVQLLMLLSSVGVCVANPSYRTCGEGIFFGGLATAVFIFPIAWFFAAIFGIPTILLLRRLKVLGAWTLISVSAIAGMLIYSPAAKVTYARNGLMAFWVLLYGALFAASVASVRWVVASRPWKKDYQTTGERDGQADR